MVPKFQFIVLLLQRCFVWSKGDHTHQAITNDELKVAMRYKTSRQLLWDVKTKVNPKSMLQEIALFYKKKSSWVGICFCGGMNLLVRFFCLDCTDSSYRWLQTSQKDISYIFCSRCYKVCTDYEVYKICTAYEI